MYKTQPIRVLCIPCGSGVSQEILHSLCYRRDVELYGLDSNGNTPGKALFGKKFYHGAPLLSERKQLLEYVKYFVSLHQIKYIFPGTDDFVNFLKENEEFLGEKVITSSLATCIVARSKRLTYKILGRVIRVPKMFKLEEIQEVDFPYFIKPDRGAGSIGCKKVDTMEDLVSVYDRERDIVCEHLPGKEITVDCLTGPSGDILYHCPRERDITRAGISIVTSTIRDSRILEQVQDMAHKINNTIEFIGAWFFQIKEKDGELCLLEIAPRVGGSSSHSRMGGVNLPLLSLNIAIGLPVKVQDFYPPERTMKVYRNYMDPPEKFDNLYLDLDDTVLLHGRVNPEAMACIYKYSGRGVPIHLITRNPGDLKKLLTIHHIPETIFTSIRQIFDMGPKSDHMLPNSVFIDDSFKERSECSSVEKNIRCYDTDSFSFL